ncbi:MAG: hypothetical protein ALECFALPRED_005071 [Alectoria fallacina]|uniref:C3H1-type domain-containing protein n=1 Tax=Alectoria fallacina TaxID=1903189 RepID=A0A8H3FYS3_9LECA|nr:MAG: hypothetical protein ALECFALPRED_005071 [Alectoria fallacina]
MDLITSPAFLARYADSFNVACCISIVLLGGIATYVPRIFPATAIATIEQEIGVFVFENGVLLPHHTYLYEFSETGEPYILGKKLPGIDYSATEAGYAKFMRVDYQTFAVLDSTSNSSSWFGESKGAAMSHFTQPLLWFLFGIFCVLAFRWTWSKLAARLSSWRNNKAENTVALPTGRIEEEHSKLNHIWRSTLVSLCRERKTEISILSRLVVKYYDRCWALVAKIEELKRAAEDMEAEADVVGEIADMVGTQVREIETAAQTAFDNLKEEHAAELKKQKRAMENLREGFTAQIGDLEEALTKKDKIIKDQEEKIDKIKKAKKKVEDKKKTEAEKAKEASETKAKKVRSDFNAALATKDNTITEQETQIAGLEERINELSEQADERKDSELEATQLQLAAIRDELETEEVAKLDAQREKQEAVNSLNEQQQKLAATQDELKATENDLYDARRRFEAIENHLETQLNDAIKETIGLREELISKEVTDEDVGNGGVKDDEEEDVENATSGKQGRAGRLSYNRSNKLRSNKRPDGTIYTSKHPQSTPSDQQGVGERRPVDEQGALDGPEHPEAQLDAAHQGRMAEVPTSALPNDQHKLQSSNPRVARQACHFLRKFGHCRFGERCYNSHDLSMGSEKPSDPPEEPVVQYPAQQDEHNSRNSTPKQAIPVCRFFKRGNCRFGAYCRDSHDLSIGAENPGEPPEDTKGTSG